MYSFLYLDLASEKLRDLIVSTAPSKIREQTNIRTKAQGHTSQGAELFPSGDSGSPVLSLPVKARSPARVPEPGDLPASTQHPAPSTETFGPSIIAKGQVEPDEEKVPRSFGEEVTNGVFPLPAVERVRRIIIHQQE